jgi:S-DNA-T family DNA segregation ATPase FtsK/SpoIIIE
MSLFTKMKAKSKLMQTFRSGGIHLTYKTGQKTYYTMPKIHAIDPQDNKLVYVFSIPLGLDPKEVTKRVWLFQQQFGTNVELEQTNKRFILTIHYKSIPKDFTYNYQKFLPTIEKMKLPIFGGIDLNGDYVSWDMADGKPHLLCAGENGSGKSAGVRQILTTLIQYKKPSELHLYLCDPKFTEFHLFENVKHVQGKIAFEVKDIYATISKVKKLLDKRKKFIGEKHKLTGIEKYNEKNPNNKMPYVLLCIDEFAQLKKEDDAIELIETISAQGRAFGVFLLLATQRPSADIMNGLIKQNITIRIGFRHADLINARITNTIGAEKIGIKDKGRCIIKLDKPLEAQAPFLDEDIAEKILEPYKVKSVVVVDKPKDSNIQTWSFPNVNTDDIRSNEDIEDIDEVDEEKPVAPKLGLLGDDDA